MDKLKPGDKVVLIAPAAHQAGGNEWMIEKARETLADWELRVQVNCSPVEKKFYLAGDDESRAKYLLDSLRQPEIRAVFVTRGGYGSPRLLPWLVDAFSAGDRYFCGFSDLTALLLAFEQRFPHIQPVHAPGLATNAFCADSAESELNRKRLRQVLFEPDDTYEQNVEVIKPGTATGPITGGCLSVLIGLLGTPFEPDFRDKILFLEDIDEKPFRIDRMLNQLSLAGKFEQLRGIVFGDMCGCSDSQNDLGDVIADVLRRHDFPVVLGFKAGHGPVNTAFRFGQLATLDTRKRKFSLQV